MYNINLILFYIHTLPIPTYKANKHLQHELFPYINIWIIKRKFVVK